MRSLLRGDLDLFARAARRRSYVSSGFSCAHRFAGGSSCGWSLTPRAPRRAPAGWRSTSIGAKELQSYARLGTHLLQHVHGVDLHRAGGNPPREQRRGGQRQEAWGLGGAFLVAETYSKGRLRDYSATCPNWECRMGVGTQTITINQEAALEEAMRRVKQWCVDCVCVEEGEAALPATLERATSGLCWRVAARASQRVGRRAQVKCGAGGQHTFSGCPT